MILKLLSDHGSDANELNVIHQVYAEIWNDINSTMSIAINWLWWFELCDNNNLLDLMKHIILWILPNHKINMNIIDRYNFFMHSY